MQTLRWYHSRLKAMSGGEICWRVASAGRDVIDRAAFLRTRKFPPASRRVATEPADSDAWRDDLVDPPCDRDRAAESLMQSSSVVARADEICDGKLMLFGRYACDVGRSMRWNFDYSSGKATPARFAPSIDYRDFSLVGDAKVVWELNRHHHFVVLARAYRLTKDIRYARKIVEQITSWIEQCPPGVGMNWRSPLELSIRLINWVWALGLISESGLPGADDRQSITAAAFSQLRAITRKYSRYSSANNHLIGEAAGVFIAGSYFAGLRGSVRWTDQAREILSREIEAQTHSDGGHREKAMGYHLFVLEFFLQAGLVGRRAGTDFSSGYWRRLERMFEYVASFMEGGASLPMFGDSDDGYVLDLGPRADRPRELMAVGAALFGRADFKALAGPAHETATWLLGAEALNRVDAISADGTTLASKAFPDSGYYLLQCGHGGRSGGVSLTFDCGELGFGSLAAHGHADALSFTLRAFGKEVFVDPGTYDYFTDVGWRDHFRSTRAHNTVVIDGRDQSEMLGPFLWGRRAEARCVSWDNDPRVTSVVGEHDGYAAPPIGVIHRRSIRLDQGSGETVIQDELTGPGRHTAELCFHLAEQCAVTALDAHRFRIDSGAGEFFLELDPALHVSVYRGCSETRLGWISRGYHRLEPATTLIGSCIWENSRTVSSRIRIGGRSRGTADGVTEGGAVHEAG